MSFSVLETVLGTVSLTHRTVVVVIVVVVFVVVVTMELFRGASVACFVKGQNL